MNPITVYHQFYLRNINIQTCLAVDSSITIYTIASIWGNSIHAATSIKALIWRAIINIWKLFQLIALTLIIQYRYLFCQRCTDTNLFDSGFLYNHWRNYMCMRQLRLYNFRYLGNDLECSRRHLKVIAVHINNYL